MNPRFWDCAKKKKTLIAESGNQECIAVPAAVELDRGAVTQDIFKGAIKQ
jgi:hypothetical protein